MRLMISLLSSNSYASAATLLMTLALGYIVCYLANKEKKALKSVGFAIGILIIIASSILMLGKIMWKVKSLRQTPPMPMVPQK